MNQTTAVILDSDPSRRDDTRMRLSHCGVVPICFNDEWICLENIYHVKPAFAVLRPASPAMAIRFVNISKEIQSHIPVIILSDQQEYESLVNFRWQNDLFFLPYPADEIELQEIIDSLGVSQQNPERPVLIAASAESKKRIESLPMVGLSDEPLLIQGEPGVGKRLMARALHSCSKADGAVLEYIHARDISGKWIRETRRRIDRLPVVETDGIVIFYVIENIEALSVDLQSQLLLVVDSPSQNGNDNPYRQPVRFITLAETDLEQLSRKGDFRKELYHRLSVLKITVPPLRDRREDVPVLADFFAAKYGLQERGGIVRLPDTVRTVFRNYDWPGNVAELKGVIKDALEKEDSDNWANRLEAWCRVHMGRQQELFAASDIDLNDYVKKLLAGNRDMSLKKAKQQCAMQVESRILKAALSQTRGNCKKAAMLLSISYKSMLNKAKAYRLVDGR